MKVKHPVEEFWKKENEKNEIQEIRFEKFEKWLETNLFDSLMERLLKEHDDRYIDSCYKKGYESHPNNKLQFIFDYVINKLDTIIDRSIEDYDFPTEIRFFKSYKFVIIYGQGAIERIYKDDKMIINL